MAIEIIVCRKLIKDNGNGKGREFELPKKCWEEKRCMGVVASGFTKPLEKCFDKALPLVDAQELEKVMDATKIAYTSIGLK